MLGLIFKSFLQSLGRPSERQLQDSAEAAVVLQTIMRPSVERAIRSVYDQDVQGRIHLLVGVDKRLGDGKLFARLIAGAPENVTVTCFDPGYSTSRRHGGVHSNFFGGSLRTLLTFAANSRYVAYLDDDDWYDRRHLSSLLAAIKGKQWAFSKRWFVNPYNAEPMCIDTLENLGPNAGMYKEYGGFACPSSLMIDKLACASIVHAWAEAGRPQGDAEDRVFFKLLMSNFMDWGTSGEATVYCIIKPEDGMHALREKLIVDAGYPIDRLKQSGFHEYTRI